MRSGIVGNIVLKACSKDVSSTFYSWSTVSRLSCVSYLKTSPFWNQMSELPCKQNLKNNALKYDHLDNYLFQFAGPSAQRRVGIPFGWSNGQRVALSNDPGDLRAERHPR